MAKFYNRQGKIVISQMPLTYHVGDDIPADILVEETVGEWKRYEIRVVARNADHAVKIFMGVLSSVYPGIVISDSYRSLFELAAWTMVGLTTHVVERGRYYHVVAQGKLSYGYVL